MVKLYDDFKDKGLAVISVSLDERKAAWTQAIQKDGMPWVHVSDLKGWKSEVVKLYNVDSVPYSGQEHPGGKIAGLCGRAAGKIGLGRYILRWSSYLFFIISRFR